MTQEATARPAAFVAHQLPGRVRLKLPSQQGNTAFFAAVAEKLRSQPGIKGLRTNPRTASLLIEHTLSFAEVMALAQHHALFDVDSSAGTEQEAGAQGINPMSLTAMGFTGMAFYQAAKGDYAGSAVENLWSAYNASRTLHMPLVTAALIGVGLYQALNGEMFASAASLLYYAVSARQLATGETNQPAD